MGVEVTTRLIENIVITTKDLKDRKKLLDGRTVENKGK